MLSKTGGAHPVKKKDHTEFELWWINGEKNKMHNLPQLWWSDENQPDWTIRHSIPPLSFRYFKRIKQIFNIFILLTFLQYALVIECPASLYIRCLYSGLLKSYFQLKRSYFSMTNISIFYRICTYLPFLLPWSVWDMRSVLRAKFSWFEFNLYSWLVA